jgi:hypothetical protein
MRAKLSADTLSRVDKIRATILLANGHPVLVTDIETGEITEYSSMRSS